MTAELLPEIREYWDEPQHHLRLCVRLRNGGIWYGYADELHEAAEPFRRQGEHDNFRLLAIVFARHPRLFRYLRQP